MAKVHPQALKSAGPGSGYITSKQESFTIWMKSLVLNGVGCTVFDSTGQIVYRVDNYNNKSRDEVFLMDSTGAALFSLKKKKSKLFKFWEGYKFNGTEIDEKTPEFEVRRTCRLLGWASSYKIILGREKGQSQNHYKLEIWAVKSECRILDQFGGLVAELKKKKSTAGTDFGDDVFTMVVEPNVDLSLIMGFVVVGGLISCRM